MSFGENLRVVDRLTNAVGQMQGCVIKSAFGSNLFWDASRTACLSVVDFSAVVYVVVAYINCVAVSFVGTDTGLLFLVMLLKLHGGLL